MPGRCVVGGCSAFPDVQKGLILHAIPFLDDERPEARKRRKKWVDFVKQKRAKWEPTRNSSICSKHFTEEDYVRHFTFVDELTEKPIVPRLKRDEIGVTAVPSVHAEAVTKTPVISESAKRRLERAVRLENLCFKIVSNFFIYLYGEHSKCHLRKAFPRVAARFSLKVKRLNRTRKNKRCKVKMKCSARHRVITT